MPEPAAKSPRRRLARSWPWLVLVLAVIPAFWHVLDFPDDRDPEYPTVARPTFSRRPPPAYRLAEPGDTIDRVAIYVSAGAVVLSLTGAWLQRRRPGLWPSALALSIAALWHSATPGPTFDGWHGLGWRTIADPSAPGPFRASLASAAILLSLVIFASLRASRPHWAGLWRGARDRDIVWLSLTSLVLVTLRQFEIPGVEPVGYWPRWAQVVGLIAFDLSLVRILSDSFDPWTLRKRAAWGTAGALGWFALVVGGIWLTWYHRPLERLHTVVPGKIYISAIPSARGLAVAQERHHFRTIINLFPEDTPFRSPRLPEELRFAESHGIRYLGSPSDEAGSDAFLDQTLAIARDPGSWPILVHCHGCMDRSPAWMGIYRFVVQRRPLAEVLREIERHRGYRPKASVTLLFNHVLPSRAPDHYASDPTAALLRRCAAGAIDPYKVHAQPDGGKANLGTSSRVSRRGGRGVARPNLTPGRPPLEYQRTHRDPPLHRSSSRS